MLDTRWYWKVNIRYRIVKDNTESVVEGCFGIVNTTFGMCPQHAGNADSVFET